MIRTALSGLSGLAGAVAAQIGVRSMPERYASWDRTSFSGATVSLTEGMAAGAGMVAGAASLASRAGMGSTLAIGSAWAAGYIDDHMEDRFPAKGKGLHGHLGALREGKITSGVLKIALIGTGAALGAATLPRRGRWLARTATWAGQTALVAGTANIVNLLDLRPGRALKASSAIALPLVFSSNTTTSSLAATTIAVSGACAPEDLAGKTMLGDTGANAIGAGVGMALASSRSPWVRWGSLAGIVALTLASEKVSFSQIISENRILSAIDEFGRP